MSFGCQWWSITLVAIERDVFEELPFRKSGDILTSKAVVLCFEEEVGGGALGGAAGEMCCPCFRLPVCFFTLGHLYSSLDKGRRVVDELRICPH